MDHFEGFTSYLQHGLRMGRNLIVVVPVEEERDLPSHPQVQSVPGNDVHLDHVVGQ